MADEARKLVVVSDLDGTLLDHHDYSFDEVLPVLARMEAAGIPLVVNTSKTRAEWLAMREDFGNRDPFIVENGSAYYDGERVEVFGRPRDEILAELKGLRGKFRFTGYADVGVAGIMAWTGLGRQAAERSADRQFSEPLVWQDTPEAEKEFGEVLTARGFMTLRGGRFLHVLGQTDKGKPLAALRQEKAALIALGDRPNDLAMLEAADIGVVIAAPDGFVLEGRDLLRSTRTGPRGWAEMMTQILDELNIPQTPKDHG